MLQEVLFLHVVALAGQFCKVQILTTYNLFSTLHTWKTRSGQCSSPPASLSSSHISKAEEYPCFLQTPLLLECQRQTDLTHELDVYVVQS